MSKCNQSLFTWYSDGQFYIFISTHVDDFYWGGTKIFQVAVINKLRSKSVTKSEGWLKFCYIGLDMKQITDKLIVSQDEYVQSFKQKANLLIDLQRMEWYWFSRYLNI